MSLSRPERTVLHDEQGRETGAWTLSGDLSRDGDRLAYRGQLLDSRVRFEAGERVVRVETQYQIVARRSHDRNTIHAGQSWPERICP